MYAGFCKMGIYKIGISAVDLYDGVSDSQESRMIHFSHPTTSYVMQSTAYML